MTPQRRHKRLIQWTMAARRKRTKENKENIVVVLGGTGFLGRRVVRHPRAHDVSVRIASRHPNRGYELFGRDDPNLRSVGANIHDERSGAAARMSEGGQ